jgi:hypothetical protein
MHRCRANSPPVNQLRLNGRSTAPGSDDSNVFSFEIELLGHT